MKPILLFVLVAALGAGAPFVARAQTVTEHDAHHAPSAATAAAAPLAEGEIRKIDQAAASVTIRHGPIAALNMPSMTMAYRVTDRSLLDRVKTGDRVRFSAEKVGDEYKVSRIEPMR